MLPEREVGVGAEPQEGSGKGRKIIRLDPSDITVLMGFDAELRGNLCEFPGWKKSGEKLTKRTRWKKLAKKTWWVENWKSPDDSFVWTVEVPLAGYYQVYMLGTGKDSEIEIVAGDSKITGWVNNGWDIMHAGKWVWEFTVPDKDIYDYYRQVWCGFDRMPIGTLHLPAGNKVTITMSARKVGEDLALYSLELVQPEAERTLAEKAEKLRSSTRWLADAKYGVFFHWCSSIYPRRGEKKPFPKNVEDFNVDAFVDMVNETGAGYIILTTTWAEHTFPAPIKAIDNILPGRTSKRDLLMEIADGLAEHGIKLMLYYNSGGPGGSDGEWWERTKSKFFDNWCAIMSEVGRRYGEKLAGWWFDGGHFLYQLNSPFERMGMAVKAGNPDRIISYNSGHLFPKFTDFQDYFSGEGPLSHTDQSHLRHLPKGGSGILTGGRQNGLQSHMCFPLDGWIHLKPDTDIGPPTYERDEFIRMINDAVERRNVPSIAIEVYEDGTASPQTLELMRALRIAIRGK